MQSTVSICTNVMEVLINLLTSLQLLDSRGLIIIHYLNTESIFSVLKPEYFQRIEPIVGLLTHWFFSSACHQGTVISRHSIDYVGLTNHWFPRKKIFRYLCHLSIEKCRNIRTILGNQLHVNHQPKTKYCIWSIMLTYSSRGMKTSPNNITTTWHKNDITVEFILFCMSINSLRPSDAYMRR